MDSPDCRLPELSGNKPHCPRKRLLKSDKMRFKSEFDHVRTSGRKAVGRALLAVTAESPDNSLKCGVICGRKFSTLAVTRNRARRLLWESFRLLKPGITPCCMVLIPRRKILEMKRQQVTMELAALLYQLKVLDKNFADFPPEC